MPISVSVVPSRRVPVEQTAKCEICVEVYVEIEPHLVPGAGSERLPLDLAVVGPRQSGERTHAHHCDEFVRIQW